MAKGNEQTWDPGKKEKPTPRTGQYRRFVVKNDHRPPGGGINKKLFKNGGGGRQE